MSPINPAALGLGGTDCASDLLAAGHDYVSRLRWPVGLTYAGTSDGRCACSSADCTAAPFKHPRGGFEKVTRDPDQLATWVDELDGASGLFLALHHINVVDVDLDVRDGGRWQDELPLLEAQLGALPATITYSTPSGGEHRLYKVEPAQVADLPDKVYLAPHVELRLRGAATLPPTPGYSGGAYRWTVAP